MAAAVGAYATPCCLVAAELPSSCVPPSITFDIASQDLERALDQYGALAGRTLLYETRDITGRQSAPLQGCHTPDSALRRLLRGSGLQAEYTSERSFVLSPVAVQADTAPAAPLVDGFPPPSKRYAYGLLQTAIAQALCADAMTAPGGYQVGVRFWFDGSGALQQLRLLGSSGSQARDVRLLARLRGLTLGAPTPSSVRQPMTVLITPAADGCGRGGVP